MKLSIDDTQRLSLESHAKQSGLTVTEYLLGLHQRAKDHQISGRVGLQLIRAVNNTLEAVWPLIEEVTEDDCPELITAIRDLQTAILPFRRSRRTK